MRPSAIIPLHTPKGNKVLQVATIPVGGRVTKVPVPAPRPVSRRSRLRATLEVAGGAGAIVLNDRRIPGTEAAIAVAPAGVFVIDAQHPQGSGPRQAPRCHQPAGPAPA